MRCYNLSASSEKNIELVGRKQRTKKLERGTCLYIPPTIRVSEAVRNIKSISGRLISFGELDPKEIKIFDTIY